MNSCVKSATMKSIMKTLTDFQIVAAWEKTGKPGSSYADFARYAVRYLRKQLAVPDPLVRRNCTRRLTL